MVGGPVGLSVYDTQIIDGETVPDTLDYFGVTQQPDHAIGGLHNGLDHNYGVYPDQQRCRYQL